MAVTSSYMKEEQKRVNNQKNSTPTYGANLNPVSAQKKAQMTQITQPAAQYTVGANPGSYVSRYQGALDSIMKTLQNPDEFRYEFNGDELFKSYADQYTQRGKQAMLDTMGQAAGLTGGYGNSYAQQVGQQSYQNYLQDLYDRGFDLRNTAYQSYRDQLADLQDLYNNYSAAEAQDYGRYQDAYNAYEAQRQYELQQEQLRLQREQWEWQKAQAEAAAAAAAAASSSSTPTSKPQNPRVQTTVQLPQSYVIHGMQASETPKSNNSSAKIASAASSVLHKDDDPKLTALAKLADLAKKNGK